MMSKNEKTEKSEKNQTFFVLKFAFIKNGIILNHCKPDEPEVKNAKTAGDQKMTIDEFKSNLINPNVEIDYADFEIIHAVYQFHPLAKSKKDIANLYEIGGMILINDMYPRAKAIGQVEAEMLAAKRKYDELNEKYMELKRA